MNLHAMGSTTDASRPGAQLLPHHIKNNNKKAQKKEQPAYTPTIIRKIHPAN